MAGTGAGREREQLEQQGEQGQEQQDSSSQGWLVAVLLVTRLAAWWFLIYARRPTAMAVATRYMRGIGTFWAGPRTVSCLQATALVTL